MKAVTRSVRRGLRTLVLGIAVCLAAGAAEARTAACDGLERQLAKAQGGSQSSGGSKWDDAARQQAAAINAAERDASYFRCSAQPGTPKCAGLLDKISRMKGNLAKIERQRAKGNPAAARSARDVTRLQAALLLNRCSESPARVEKTRGSDALETQKPSGLLNRLLGGAEADDRPVFAAPPQPAQQLAATSAPSEIIGERRSRARVSDLEEAGNVSRVRVPANGTFRTLCVRTCDGYFFPISFSTSSDKFAQDAQVCSSMCPAAQTELFIYRNPGGEPEEMISLAGIAYKDLPNAFRHRKEYVEGCSCQAKATGTAGLRVPGPANMSMRPVAGTPLPPANTLALSGDEIPQTGSLRASVSPLPADAIADDVDPDTRLNLGQGFDPTIRIDASTVASTVATPAAGLDVRGAAPSETAASQTPEAPSAKPSADGGMEAATEPAAPRGPVRQVGPKFYPDR